MAEVVTRTIRLITQQNVLDDTPPIQEGYPMREWSIKVVMLNDKKEEVPANILDKVTYTLHPTFSQPIRHLKKPPFLLTERGWGEFDMEITFNFIDKAGSQTIRHDLHFQENRYENDHKIKVPVNGPKMAKALAASGNVPAGAEATDDANGTGRARDKRKAETDNKVKKRSKLLETDTPDLEKMADLMQKLNEDDLLHIVQMVHDMKSPDTYYKNDVEQGEFHVDLYTLPDDLAKKMWTYVISKVSE
ncbi:transcription initiation factor TFIID subunit 14 [Ascobolus immersus RN42]|uniref:Transcription initiation factor TFIID subunit 14 n=1 Tax=Ascobolus immersus RN42 TaxID=1160509 RepID=A0A3N4I7K9_ASCIM|nr:transcription initiation factor TFIID subunit 14 [Ascobolus immersus RN42]